MSSIATYGKEEGEQCSNLCNMNNIGGTETKNEETEADGSKGLSWDDISDEALIKHIMLRKKSDENTSSSFNECCAACGKEEGEGNKLKSCTACNMVK